MDFRWQAPVARVLGQDPPSLEEVNAPRVRGRVTSEQRRLLRLISRQASLISPIYYYIHLPAILGVEDGMTIRVPAAGDAPLSGKGNIGDLLVRVNVATSKVFRRQGANLHHEARIPVHVALLGGRIRVPTLDGHVDVRVPSGTQHGEEMVLRNHGVPSVFGRGKGDLFVSFVVQLPR